MKGRTLCVSPVPPSLSGDPGAAHLTLSCAPSFLFLSAAQRTTPRPPAVPPPFPNSSIYITF